MQNIKTKSGNLGEIIYTNGELRLFGETKDTRLFQGALTIDGDTVKITLGASFVKSELKTLREVKEVLKTAGFKIVKFTRDLDGKVITIDL